MFQLKPIIFDFWGTRDRVDDINKDVNNRGFLQRFIEIMAEDFDEEEMLLIENIVANTQDPYTCFERFLPYREKTFGGLLDLILGDSMRRKIIAFADFLHMIRSTKSGYIVLFRWLGFTATITEGPVSYSFDSAITFDHVDRRFDSKCRSCSSYSIELVGSGIISPEIVQAIFNIIIFNQPINALLTEVTLNGSPIINNYNVQFYIDTNGDLFYINPYDPTFHAYIDGNGDLIIESDFANFYSQDVNGDIIFTTA